MSGRPLAVILGVGEGLSASLARLLAREGFELALAARSTGDLGDLAAETGADVRECDATDAGAVAALFAALPRAPELAIYNPSAREKGPIADLDPEKVRRAWEVTAFGAFLFGQQAARAMLAAGRGTILFTGASAGSKGFPRSASFAMGKFALRGLAQSMSRELHPQNVHVAYVNIDGGILWPSREEPDDRPDSMLRPDAIAETYLHLHRQHRSAWSEEVAVRPWTENF